MTGGQSLLQVIDQTLAKFIRVYLRPHRLNRRVNYNKGGLFAITLESAGTTAFVDNDFRLLGQAEYVC